MLRQHAVRAYHRLFPHNIGFRYVVKATRDARSDWRYAHDGTHYPEPMPPVVAPPELQGDNDYTELYPGTALGEQTLPNGLPGWSRGAYFFYSAERYGPYGVSRIRNARVSGTGGCVRLPTGELLGGIWRDPIYDLRFFWQYVAERQDKTPPIRLRGLAVMLTTPWVSNYYHFRLQCLPRIKLALSVVDMDEVDHWLVSPVCRSFQRELYAAVGIAPEKMVELPDEAEALVEELLVPSIPAECGYAPRWVVDYNRSLVRPDPAFPVRERIYLTRGGALSRLVLNADALRAMLEARGLETVDTDGLSLAEQAALVANAREIVAVHGAALTNLLHARPGTRVIELSPASYVTGYFSRMSPALETRHTALVGSEWHLPAARYWPLQGVDTVVDLSALRRALAD